MTQTEPGVAAIVRGMSGREMVAVTRPLGSMRQSRGSAASPTTQMAPSPVVIEQRHMR